ncbi:DUF1615 domain-containing protein [Nitrogeniibacter mangrovi]|uniref:DUF1615 domain-containing protein n=1 Tax=Nitrogeniibacter mangrovi TaxID=2016596 RepID=A0A6C1B3P5_9RHOO|nr:DUF1615 domain-containing protein [Nitrogeniibacter mangrovi]QID17468.1 DUF1615 domain-containing protein [Nitrogeniibacter mangrovi]
MIHHLRSLAGAVLMAGALSACQSGYLSLPSPELPGQAPGAPRYGALALLPTGIADRAGWAREIDTAFSHLQIPATASNLCAAMAIIEQESTWQADPVVPGLPRIVNTEIYGRAERYHIPALLVTAALKTHSPDGRSYEQRIAALRTERQMNTLFNDMLSELPLGKTLFSGFNPIRTGGPMQVSVRFAEDVLRERGYPYERTGSVRDEVFTRRGGLYFGIANLLDYPAPYPHPRYRFADFNAGRYSSRNAGFQTAVARLTGRKLAPDGDLLRYVGERPSDALSQTEAAVRALGDALGLDDGRIRDDLEAEKSADFADTRTYQRVFALADRRFGAVPRQAIPDILLKSPKIRRKLTTRWFAQRVESRYDTCLQRVPR